MILRPAIVLGAGADFWLTVRWEPRFQTPAFSVGDPEQNPLPCVLARDVAGALVLAKDAQGIEGLSFNLSGDIRPTARDFVGLLRERTRRDFRFYPRNLWAMGAFEWLIWATKAAVRKSENSRISYRDLQSLTMAADLDCSAAKKLLGWQPESDRDVFFREAIDSHLQTLPPPGDLRLEAIVSDAVDPCADIRRRQKLTCCPRPNTSMSPALKRPPPYILDAGLLPVSCCGLPSMWEGALCPSAGSILFSPNTRPRVAPSPACSRLNPASPSAMTIGSVKRHSKAT